MFGAKTLLLLIAVELLSFGQSKPCKKDTDQSMTCIIELQGGQNFMEPKAEPSRIRIDDRSPVRIRVVNLSPLDVCTLNGRTPTPTAETPVGESFVGTIAALGGFSAQLTQVKQASVQGHTEKIKPIRLAKPDPELTKITTTGDEFFCWATKFVLGTATEECKRDYIDDPKSPFNDSKKPIVSQLEIAHQGDEAGKDLANYAGADYREDRWKNFVPDTGLSSVVKWYEMEVPSIEAAGRLQAMVDEMSAWAADLHKKYDFKAPAAGDSGPSGPNCLPVQAVLATPTTLSFSYTGDVKPDSQTIHVCGGGLQAQFTVVANAPWLSISPPNGTTPTQGSVDISVTADPTKLAQGKTSDTGTITIAGNGQVNIINVALNPSKLPSDADLTMLRQVDEIVDRAKAVMSLIGDNNKTLEAAQTTLKASRMALTKVYEDFKRRKDPKRLNQIQEAIMSKDGKTVLVQDFNLGTDRKATITGNISCVTDIDGKTATTDAINFSFLYQDVPHWTASAGFLTTFQQKKVIGITDVTAPSTTNPTPPPATLPNYTGMFAVTDQARAQVFPMAYVNYRPWNYYHSTYFGKGKKDQKEDELVWTAQFSAGFGINPNSGTNQPEFFTGMAIGLNRLMIHPGIHWGRTESLGGGFALNTSAPSGVTVPLNWSYHPAFSIGFSVRVAPY